VEELELFLEDMDEQLSLMEGALLDMQELSISDIDKEMINTVFRAMHTMKGNAGMFGYDVIVQFSHLAENLSIKRD
jgi:two-component system chemotaxis sensor kinase CheA